MTAVLEKAVAMTGPNVVVINNGAWHAMGDGPPKVDTFIQNLNNTLHVLVGQQAAVSTLVKSCKYKVSNNQ